MKFKEKSIVKTPHRKKDQSKKKSSTPFKINIVDIKPSEDSNVVETPSKKEKRKSVVKKKSKFEEKKPNINLIVTEDDELNSLQSKEEDFDEEFSDGDVNEGDYENFMEEMAKIDGKKKKILSNRVEGTGEVSEYNLSGHKAAKIDTSGLVSALGNAEEDVRNLQKRLTRSEDELKLDTALDSVSAARVTRGAGYTALVKDISVWDAVVHSRRAADTLSFPLNKADLKLKSLNEDGQKFKPETSLEQQVAALLAGAPSVAAEGEVLSEIEKKCLEGLTVHEALERKKELAKMRALQTYQEQKFRRMKKIKSKKFRKIERKMKKKEELAEIEQLSKIDPEAAAEKLEQLDKARIQERASLKHRNASKFLQDTAKRAKITKNKDFTNVVNEQLRKHRDLTTKQNGTTEDDDNDDIEADVRTNVEFGSVEEFNSDYRKFWEQNQAKKKMETSEDLEEIFDEAEYSLKQNNKSKINSLKTPTITNKPEDQEKVVDDTDNPLNNIQADSLKSSKNPSERLKPNLNESTKEKTPLPNVNPDDFINMKSSNISSDLPEIVGYNELEDDEDDQRDIIAEAFADDNVVDEFKNEKTTLKDSKKPKDIDLTLPGWGEWGGGGAAPSRRKRKRFTVKAPPPDKRRDENTGHLILNTDKDTKLRKHQVSNVPFPFNAVSDFEASIRAPVGSTFIPRTAHLKMIKPRMTTKAGHVIEPMDRDQLVKRGLVDIAAPIS